MSDREDYIREAQEEKIREKASCEMELVLKVKAEWNAVDGVFLKDYMLGYLDFEVENQVFHGNDYVGDTSVEELLEEALGELTIKVE